MSQFKRFNSSDNTNWDTYASYPAGTLTWDPNNGLRLHDGSSGGGSPVGGSSNFYDLTNRPTGNTAVHDLQGGSSSAYNGYFLKQTSTGVSEWSALPTTYDTLTIDTKIIGGIDGAGGTQITGIEASLGSGAPYRYVFLSANDAFGNLFNRGSSIIGWKMYPANDPGAFVTITEFLNNDLGGPSLGFSGSLAQGPWIAESSDYSAGANGPLTLSADTKNWVLGTDGTLTLPAGGYIKNSDGINIVPQGLSTGDSPEFAGLYISGSSGNEGGEIRLALPANTGLGGDGISIDIYQDKLRIFENGGSARGVYIDLSTATTNVGTDLLSSFSGSYDDLSNKPTIPADVSDLTDTNGLLPAAQVRYIMKDANFTAEAGKTYWLDSGSSAKTVTLPASPTTGDWVKIYDGSLNWTTYNLTVSGNGNQIRTVNMMGAPSWNSAASTVTLNQNAISPNGPLAAMFIWNGTNWYSAA
jgi:hypothetical protein